MQPGEYRTLQMIKSAARKSKRKLTILPDDHFYTTPDDFAEYAEGKKEIRMEFFYRNWRKNTGVLMKDGHPVGDQWNFDQDNRKSIKSGKISIPAHRSFSPDPLTQTALADVDALLPENPGIRWQENFDWPVNREQALEALGYFIEWQLPLFGDYQDALKTGEPYLFHSRLSAAMNLKLLNPREVVNRAVAAFESGGASINSVEGFIRQILGWREYVRGIYWHYMPEYSERNALDAQNPLPSFYWTGNTEANCLGEAVGQTLRLGYAHHIQRLMITGLFSLLWGTSPKMIHEWYLAVYVDAVEWVELPNTIGMSQYADGGLMASKPYCASANYINKMSDYCKSCRYDPKKSHGKDACPFNVLYRDFLWRNEKKLQGNPRMALQYKNLSRAKEKKEIRKQAEELFCKS